ncbi:MAG: hypothetical protein A2W33_06220 [Chloroflexi bacterium RBG_16_52_11]|nr:MAG: hypothetical protein A2W33_06220 [Chloroflexi bacterium RBG_16_52_11]
MSTAILLGSVWIFILLGLFLALPRLISRQRNASFRLGWLVVILVAMFARLVPNLILPMGSVWEMQMYQSVGDLVLRGEDVYSNPETENYHPYLPFQMYWMAISRWCAEQLQLPFVKIYRLAPILADTAIALLIYLNLRNRSAGFTALLGGLLYAINPVTVYVSAYQGQFDAIPALMILLSLQWLSRSPSKAGGWIGLGILIKNWPVLALPSLLTGIHGVKNKLTLLVTASITILAGVGFYILLFPANPVNILIKSLVYNQSVGVWGFAYLIRLPRLLEPTLSGPHQWLLGNGRYITLLGLALIFWFKARRESPQAGIFTILLAFLAITHAFSIQYLMWVVPFAILELEWRWLNRYTIGAFAYMFLTYTTFILEPRIMHVLPWPQADWWIIIPAGIPVWLVTVGWLIHRLRTTESKRLAGKV